MSTAKPESEPRRRNRARFVLKPGFLDEQSKRWFARIPFDSPSETLASVVREVEEGSASVLDVYQDGKRVGFTIYRIEDGEFGRECEFVSLASFAEGFEGDATRGNIPALEEIARKLGCRFIRLHTMREGLCRKLLNEGWFVSEIVMRKEL